MDIIEQENIRQLWDNLAKVNADKTALIFEDILGFTREYSYVKLNQEINKAANLFLSLGVKKSCKVLIQLRNSPEFLFSLFGLAKIGAIAVPVNAHYLYDECFFIAKKCEAKLAIIEEDFLPTYEKLQEDKNTHMQNILIARASKKVDNQYIDFNLSLSKQNSVLNEIVPISNQDTAEILFTSGTTSFPKGVVITHYNLMFAGKYTSWQCSLRKDDRYLTVMPAWHIDFQCTAAMPTFVSGATFILLEKYSARKFWNQVCVYRATITECIPKIMCTLLMQPKKAWEQNHCLREVFYYLNMCDKDKDAFIERFNVKLLTSYGMSETIVGLIGDRPGDERKWPSIGKIGFAYEAKVINCEGKEVKANEIGDLYIKGIPGKTIFKEYYNEPEATKKALDEKGWFNTKDSVYIDECGYFYFVDRKSNLIKNSGENVSSIEVENFLCSHPKIAEAAVIGIEDKICNELIKAFVVLNDEAQMNESEIIEYCFENLAKFKVPSKIEILDSLPKTITGKIKKNSLREKELIKH